MMPNTLQRTFFFALSGSRLFELIHCEFFVTATASPDCVSGGNYTSYISNDCAISSSSKAIENIEAHSVSILDDPVQTRFQIWTISSS
jgi:hypothetical protein